MILIILGTPGSGKTTQADIISKKLKIPAISMGRILRRIKDKTEIGREANKYMKEGELIPPNMIRALLKMRLSESDCGNGFILDGSPRRIGEAVAIDMVLKKEGKEVDKVILIEISEKEAIKRLLRRAELPSKIGGGRNDDEKFDIVRRLKIFKERIDLIKEYYIEQDKLRIIDGKGKSEEVESRICNYLQI